MPRRAGAGPYGRWYHRPFALERHPATHLLRRLWEHPEAVTPEELFLWRCLQLRPEIWHQGRHAAAELLPFEHESGLDVAWTRYLWSDVRGVAWLATLSGLCMAPVTIVHYG